MDHVEERPSTPPPVPDLAPAADNGLGLGLGPGPAVPGIVVPVPQSLASWSLALPLLLLLCLGLLLVSSLLVIRTFSCMLKRDSFARTTCTSFSRLWYQSRECLLVSWLALLLLGETLLSCPSFSRVWALVFLVGVLDLGTWELWVKLFPDYILTSRPPIFFATPGDALILTKIAFKILV